MATPTFPLILTSANVPAQVITSTQQLAQYTSEWAPMNLAAMGLELAPLSGTSADPEGPAQKPASGE